MEVLSAAEQPAIASGVDSDVEDKPNNTWVRVISLSSRGRHRQRVRGPQPTAADGARSVA